MTKVTDIYKCYTCGNIVQSVVSGVGELVCCNHPMVLLEPKLEETLFEKHKPVIEQEGETKKIKVGSVPHPMENDHYIMFIDVISPDKKYVKRKHLKPHETPELELKCNCDEFIAREYCNLHGFFETEYKA